MNHQSPPKVPHFFHKIRTNEHTIMAILAVIVGLAGGFGAIGFRYLINFIQSLFYGVGENILELAQSTSWYWRILIPAIGGLIVGPVTYFLAREAKGHGVPEVMEAVALNGGIIRKRIVFVKSIASAISIASGGSVGREGPIVQIGSAIGSSIGQILKISVDRIRTLVGCGAAAGIAATFNAPIAGAMFALEIILGDFGLAIFSPIVISAVVATAVSRHFLGDTPAFVVPAYQLVNAWEFPMYVVLGLFCGFVAWIFTKTLYKSEDLFDSIRFPEYLKATIGGLMLGGMSLLFPYILGVGYPAMDMALSHELSWWLLFLLIAVKIMATSITIGSGGSGGIFAPSLFVGAMTGGVFGTIIHDFFPTITAPPAAYSIVGMGAVVSGTTHGPLSAMLILFEMTGDYKIILPLMIACIISSLMSSQLSIESIYTLKLIRRGINIKGGREVNVLKDMKVMDVMNPTVETIPENMPLGRFAEKISRSKYNSFPIIDDENYLKGMLSFYDYREAIFEENLKDLIVARDIATTDQLITVTSDDNLYDALERITFKDFALLPVVSPQESTKLVGVLTRSDIISAYNKAVIKKSVFKK